MFFKNKLWYFILVSAMVFFNTCATGSNKRGTVLLDKAIQNIVKDIEDNVAGGSRIALLNFSSPTEEFSAYILEELANQLVKDKKLVVVDRAELDIIRKELDFQMSAEVSDESARAIGKMLGADIVLTGSLQTLGDAHRFRVRALEVESAVVKASSSSDIDAKEKRVEFLLGAAGESQGASSKKGNTSRSGQLVSEKENSTGADPVATSSAPSTASVNYSRAGVYANEVYQGAMNLNDALLWIKYNFQDNGSYVIVLNEHDRVLDGDLSYNKMKVHITLKASGGRRIIWFNYSEGKETFPYSYQLRKVPEPIYYIMPASPIFTVGPGVTLTIEEGVILSGDEANKTYRYEKELVKVDGGEFVMNGGSLLYNKTTAVYVESGSFIMHQGTISGNNNSIVNVSSSGTFIMHNGIISDNKGIGVKIEGGSFTMNGGVISGNTGTSNIYHLGGGGVTINSGTFTMHNGVISDNKGNGVSIWGGSFTMNGGAISGNIDNEGRGGGVCVNKGSFIMHTGTISGNTAHYGGGVYIYNGSSFIMNNGVISGNTSRYGEGGGVFIYGGNQNGSDGSFIKSGSGGVIYGSDAPEGKANKAKEGGQAVCMGTHYDGGSINIKKKRNTTVQTSNAMYSNIDGVAGGWE